MRLRHKHSRAVKRSGKCERERERERKSESE